MGGTEIMLVAAVILIPLAIAVAVTLWTLEPAAQRAERAKRGKKRSQAAGTARAKDRQPPESDADVAESAERDEGSIGIP